MGVHVVGLCYFATYCNELGRVDNHNIWSTSRVLSGAKLNIVIKSSLFGVQVADYTQSRKTYTEADFIMRYFFNEMGFGNTVNIDREQDVNIETLKFSLCSCIRREIDFANRRY